VNTIPTAINLLREQGKRRRISIWNITEMEMKAERAGTRMLVQQASFYIVSI
jgi:hypothetical protein